MPPELTPEEAAELEEAEKRPVAFVDDCPEINGEILSQFHRMNTVTIEFSRENG